MKKILLATSTIFTASVACGAIVQMQNATASFSQFGFAVGAAIDGTIDATNGWAIDENPTATSPQAAVFELVTPISSPGGFSLTFTLSQSYLLHSLGRFQVSLTADDRSAFGDGLSSAGDITANWVIFNPTGVSASNGATLNVLGDSSILASGTRPNTTTYFVTGTSNLTTITGFRLDVLTDLSLPDSGPGRNANGNFVLSEISLDAFPAAIPEPAAFTVLLGAGALLVGIGKRRRLVTGTCGRTGTA